MTKTKQKPLILHPHEIRAALEGRLGQVRRPVQVPATIRVGDVLWCRETWNVTHLSEALPGENIKPESACARDNRGFATACADGVVYAADGIKEHPEYGKAIWRPSTQMPRWAARIILEVTAVRVGRLENASDEDALAEGICVRETRDGRFYHHDPSTPGGNWWCHPDDAHRAIWNHHYAKKGLGWDTNPWTVVYGVKDLTTMGEGR